MTQADSRSIGEPRVNNARSLTGQTGSPYPDQAAKFHFLLVPFSMTADSMMYHITKTHFQDTKLHGIK
jgi:hypothetical protein